MSLMTAAGVVYRLPPFVLGPEILVANDLTDIVDWGLKIHQVPDHWLTAGEGIVVGVADTGRPTHSDLAEAVKTSRNFSSSYTDEDLLGHGTHVCGVLAARQNGRGIVGVAPKCEIVTAKVLGDDASGDVLSIANGLHWLAEQGCHIINMSLGGAFDETVAKTVKEIVDAGIFVICSAGNEGNIEGRDTVGYPARLPYTIAITSYNRAGEISAFASRGEEVDLAMPGEDILSCWLKNAYRRISGTSMATPFASGLVALLLAASRNWPPEERVKNNSELLALIQEVTVDRGAIGVDRDWGWGVVDINRFIQRRPVKAVAQSVDPLPLSWPPGLHVEKILHEGRQGVFISTT